MGDIMMLDVVGYEGLYKVSLEGAVYSVKSNKYLKPNNNPWGYPMVTLYKNGTRRTIYVHRIVAEAWLVRPEGDYEVNHRDGDKENFSAGNLEWATKSENGYHASRTGLRKIPSGNRSKLSKQGFAISPFGQCFYFGNQKEFCELNNLQRGNFSRMLSGEYKSSKGWTSCENWRY